MGLDSVWPVVGGILVGALGSQLTTRLRSQDKIGVKARRFGKNKEHKKAFVLIVTVQFKSEADREKAIGFFETIAAYVAREEPGTLTYEMSRCDTDNTKAIISERYTGPHAHAQIHRNSPAFKKFFEQVMDETEVVSKEGISGYEVDAGFA